MCVFVCVWCGTCAVYVVWVVCGEAVCAVCGMVYGVCCLCDACVVYVVWWVGGGVWMGMMCVCV